MAQFHDDYSRANVVESGSDRAFGLTISGALLIFALFPLIHSGAIRWWWLAGSLLLAGCAIIRPGRLTRANRQWIRLGVSLSHVTGLLALGVIFFFIITPMGLGRRLFGRCGLDLLPRPAAKSYWSIRMGQASSMRDQF